MNEIEDDAGAEYSPELGNLRYNRGRVGSGAYTNGYWDINLLRSLLEQIENTSKAIVEASEEMLRAKSLRISDKDKLLEAQTVEWPEDLGDPRDYVTYDQYVALGSNKSRGSDFIRKSYEQYLRTPNGCEAIDIVKITTVVRNEASRISSFLDTYLGEIDDSSEYRVLELFQDWCQASIQFLGKLGTFLSETGSNQSVLSDEETNAVSKKDASEYQSYFQVKINVLNKEIDKVFAEINKEYEEMSPIFYDKFLGPAVKYRVKAGRNLSNTTTNGMLANQGASADRALGGNFNAILTDLLRRNGAFSRRMSDFEVRLLARRNYFHSIKQLEPHGKKLKDHFTDKTASEDEVTFFSNVVTNPAPTQNEFLSSHNYIPGRMEDDAHPQYVLTAGDKITGNIDAEPEVKFDGVDLDEHRHLGGDVDGTPQLAAEDSIIPETLVASLVKREIIDQPQSLRLVSEKICTNNGRPAISIKLGWEGEDADEYEVQIVALCDDEEDNTGCVEGHLFDYPTVACDYDATERKYLNNGFEPGSVVGGEPIYPENESPAYTNQSCFILALDDEFFIIGQDSNGHRNFEVVLCRRTGEDGEDLEYEELDHLTIATGDSYSQGAVTAIKLSANEFLVGCLNLNVPSVVLVSRDGDSMTLVDDAFMGVWGQFENPGGVNSLQLLDNRHFIAGWWQDDTSGTTPHYARAVIGTLAYTPGTTQYSNVDVDVDDIVEISSGDLLGNHVQLLALNDTKVVSLWGELTTTEFYTAGYWMRILEYSETTITPAAEIHAVKLGENDVRGFPQLSKINDDKFVVLYNEEDTSECAV